MKHQLLSLLLVSALLLTLLPVNALAAEVNKPQVSSALDEGEAVFTAGDGTVDSPYEIYTPEQLDGVRNNLKANYILMSDIDLSEYDSWQPIGINENQAFEGVFDGNGCKITNLNINSIEGTDYLGLFGYATGMIKNLGIINGMINTEDACSYLGSIVGQGSVVENCFSKCSINAVCSFGGGIAGYADSITECRYSGEAQFFAGTAVRNHSVHIFPFADGGFYGGICGWCAKKADKNHNEGNLQAAVSNYTGYLGGIVGCGYIVSESYNTGDLSINAPNYYPTILGGIAGACNEVDNCYNIGNLMMSNENNAENVMAFGFITGALSGNSRHQKISCCFDLSNYTIPHACVNWGMFGMFGTSTSERVIVESCYYIQKNNFSEDDFAKKETFEGFDFDSIWTMTNGKTVYNYPHLRYFEDYSNYESETSDSDNDVDSAHIDYFSFGKLDAAEYAKSLTIDGVRYEIAPEKLANNAELIQFTWLGDVDEHVYVLYNLNENGQLVQCRILTGEKATLNEWNGETKTAHIQTQSLQPADYTVSALVEGTFPYDAAENLVGKTVRAFINDHQIYYIMFDDGTTSENGVKFTSIYDKQQSYHDGCFYSEVSSFSDCVEIYLQLQNRVEDASDVSDITLTASVNGTGLSFDRNSAVTTYSRVFEGMEIGEVRAELLTIFPDKLEIPLEGAVYTVDLILESDDFEPVHDSYQITITDPMKTIVKSHLSFIESNPTYRVSKRNIYGENMVTLKDDIDYKWSKYSTFDFDNYYEIVFADILINLLNVEQSEMIALPKVMKEWIDTYKTLSDGIQTIVKDEYAKVLDISETKIDKLLKESKYTTDGVYTDEAFYQIVLSIFGNAGNAEKINKVFAKIDKTGQAFGYVKLGVDLVKDAMEWSNKLTLYNVYSQAEEEFKDTIQLLYDSIPESERKMREAVHDYLNFSSGTDGKVEEVLESYAKMLGGMTADVFSSSMGTSVVNYIAASAFKWIGSISISGGTATLSAAAAFTTVQSVFGGFFTGASLGLCLSDFFCNSSDKAAEMSKVVAMSEFSPYVIDMLNASENHLRTEQSADALKKYEYAFALHKATQAYIMEHTAKSLEAASSSIVIRLLMKDSYNTMISDVLAHQTVINALQCHSGTAAYESCPEIQVKVIEIRCPVDVLIKNSAGEDIIWIANDEIQLCEDGYFVFTDNGEKYVALPSTENYDIQITAREEGIMAYAITEFGSDLNVIQSAASTNIPLTTGRVFTGAIDADTSSIDAYTLHYDNNVITLTSSQNDNTLLIICCGLGCTILVLGVIFIILNKRRKSTGNHKRV